MGVTVAAVRDALCAVAAAGGVEIIVVDDGSSDRTAEAAATAGATVVRFVTNRGKGAAVRAGVLASAGRCVAFIDADLAYPPSLLVCLLGEIEAGADVVIGNRHDARSTATSPQSVLRRFSGYVFNLLAASVLKGRYRDTQCGLKAFEARCARRIFSRTRLDRFAFDVEVLHLAELDGCVVTEVPVTLAHTAGSTVHVVLDALRMVRDLVRIRRWSHAGCYAATGRSHLVSAS